MSEHTRLVVSQCHRVVCACKLACICSKRMAEEIISLASPILISLKGSVCQEGSLPPWLQFTVSQLSLMLSRNN